MLKGLRASSHCVKSLIHSKKNVYSGAAACLSTMPIKEIRNPHEMKFLPQKDVQDYMSFLPKFIEDVTSKEILLGYPPVNQRMKRLLEYMCPTGKHLRQHVLIYTYKTIEQHHGTYSQENMKEVHKLCWCLELLNTGYTIMDDIIDDHDMRRKQATWYKIAGSATANDMMLVFTSLNGIVRKYFNQHPRFNEIFDLFLTPITPVGLALELETTNFEDFTVERCDEIAEIKTAYYVGNHPFLLATLFANKELQMYDLAKKVFYYLGNIYSAQNDVLDVYGQHITGKNSTDIQDNNCTYLIAMALEKASGTQKKILKENYGKKDQKCVDKVKEIYDELDLIGEYYKLEEKYLEKASEEIRKIPDEFTRSLIEKLAYVQSFGLIGVNPL
ncbi:farnesyl pyrophosphate synthase 1-like [Coccinella septempunctata]|uniref:farnesyl pyrophosphate synthase 1-like n=1 Tax=Coccinella septempunctata TaxID=41139 RepID=UPI001D086532|nr:farnesyl pyrophosphate synthase 1-like [Coccinella septempunctata]